MVTAANLTREDRGWLLVLEGEHDLSTVPVLERRMEEVAASGTNVVIDLSRATFVDCAVVGWVVRWTERARAVDHLHLAVVVGDTTFAARMFDLLTMTGVIPFVKTREEASRSLNGGS